MLNRDSHSFNAVGQTDLDDRLLQMDNRDSELTVPLPDSPRQLEQPAQYSESSNQPQGQLQQSNLLESHTSRSRQDSTSSSVDSRVAMSPGVLSICVSPRFKYIFSELEG